MRDTISWFLLIFVSGLALLAAITYLTGCSHQKPRPSVPVVFLNCEIFMQPTGKQGCECFHPVIVEKIDAHTGKKLIYAYCDGKVS